MPSQHFIPARLYGWLMMILFIGTPFIPDHLVRSCDLPLFKMEVAHSI